MNAEGIITDYTKLDLNGTYTYADYLLWQFSDRVELIRGRIRKMSPAPNERHQSTVSDLARVFINFFHKKSCRVYLAPFDVRLPIPSGKITSTVVQPDLCVICDESKLDEQGYNGAPDLVIEILSPGNTKHELSTKFELYQECGVQEYWIAEPANKTVWIYTLQKGKYIGLQPFTEDDTIESVIFPKLKAAVEDIFYHIK